MITHSKLLAGIVIHRSLTVAGGEPLSMFLLLGARGPAELLGSACVQQNIPCMYCMLIQVIRRPDLLVKNREFLQPFFFLFSGPS